MAPEYFKRELRPYEAEAFLKGIEQAQRSSWEQTRLQMYSFLKPWSSDIKKDTDVLEFPWDKERAEAEAQTKEEIDSAREWAKEATNMLNRKYGRKRDSSKITARF
jgi:hypothetical protein